MAVRHLQPFAEQNRWPAPAKLNLCLYVVGRRDDGYHRLETLFQLLDVGDELSFDINRQGKTSRDYDFGFAESADLCLRAARLLQRHTTTPFGVKIGLNKTIPQGGGLGGGSSNAATVLIALNYLWKTGLSTAELAELGLLLGADIPLFVHGQTAWGSGIGERLEPMALAARYWLVITPNVNVETARIFAHKRLTPLPQMKKIRALKKALRQSPDLALLNNAENQLQAIVRAEFSEVEAVFEWLLNLHDPEVVSQPRLSGTGGSVFVAVKSRKAGQRLLAKRPAECSGFVAKSVNNHPLYDATIG